MWSKAMLADCFKEFFETSMWKAWHVLPMLVSWCIWLALNSGVFKDKATPTFKISEQATARIHHYNVSSALKKGQMINAIDLNKQWPWGYFDGACQGPNC